MKNNWERLVLVAFLGNYLIINIVSAIVALFPASTSGGITPQYVAFVVLAGIAAGFITWWYFCTNTKNATVRQGTIFGIGGFIIAILTTFVSGISSVLAQTGSFQKVIEILPNFGPYLWNGSTIALLAYWVIPGAAVGYYLQKKSSK